MLQGLQDKIKLVPINLQNRPAWYKEKVYPENKVIYLNKVMFFVIIDYLWSGIFVEAGKIS